MKVLRYNFSVHILTMHLSSFDHTAICECRMLSNNLDDKRNLHIGYFQPCYFPCCRYYQIANFFEQHYVRPCLALAKFYHNLKIFIRNSTITCKWAFFPHQNELNISQKTPWLQILSWKTCWKLHVRTSVSPRKLPFSVYYIKYPEQKWRRLIAKDVDFLNFRRRNTRKLQVLRSANKRIWTLYDLS
jgi:hypothetical protein